MKKQLNMLLGHLNSLSNFNQIAKNELRMNLTASLDENLE